MTTRLTATDITRLWNHHKLEYFKRRALELTGAIDDGRSRGLHGPELLAYVTDWMERWGPLDGDEVRAVRSASGESVDVGVTR